MAAPDLIAAVTHLPADWPRALGGGVLIGALGVLLLCRWCRRVRVARWTLPLPSARLAALQLLISGADLVVSAAALYVLLPESAGVTYAEFVPLFGIALAAGLLSQVPGGVGVFELVMLYGLAGRVAPQDVAAGIIAYRAIYYLLPLVVATGALTAIEARRHWGSAASLAGRRVAGPAVDGGPAPRP